MLPYKAREDLREALPETYRTEVPAGTFPDMPDATHVTSKPIIRWRYEGQSPGPPFEMLTLYLDPAGVQEDIQTMGPVRRGVDVPDSADAHTAEKHAENVYDVLNFRVTARGNRRVAGATLTPRERAGWVTNGAYDWLTRRFQNRPLDAFDEHGNVIDDSGQVYGDDLSPPVRVDRIPGRAPSDVTEQVGADGAQWDAGVELHYREEWLHYQYSATEFPMSFETDTGDVPDDPESEVRLSGFGNNFGNNFGQ